MKTVQEVATMKSSLIVRLVFATFGCGSGTEPAKPSALVAAIKIHMTPEQIALGDPIVNSIGMVLVPIPVGQFQMGSPDADNDAEDNERPQHLVKIT